MNKRSKIPRARENNPGGLVNGDPESLTRSMPVPTSPKSSKKKAPVAPKTSKKSGKKSAASGRKGSSSAKASAKKAPLGAKVAKRAKKVAKPAPRGKAAAPSKPAKPSRVVKPAPRTARPKAARGPAPSAKRAAAKGKPSAKKESSDVPTVGAPAPDFSLPSDAGGPVSLADYKGQWLVLYFYPKDNTPGCTRQAIAFEQAAAALSAKNIAVVGVSRDSVKSHCGFKDKHALRFPLLSDPAAEVHKRYGAFGEKTLYGRKIVGALRTTVVIAPDGTLAKIFPNVRVDGHVDAVLAAIAEAQG